MKINLCIFSFHLLFCFLIWERECVRISRRWSLRTWRQRRESLSEGDDGKLTIEDATAFGFDLECGWVGSRASSFSGTIRNGKCRGRAGHFGGSLPDNKHIVFLLYELWTMEFTVREFCNSIKKFIYVKVNNNSYISSQITKNSVFLSDQIVSFLCSCRRIVFVSKLG